jgi:putative tryptophan/tyrosine transport system substrate-binding protein
MRRRRFIAGLGGAVAAWPVVARAQQAAVPVIGVHMGFSEQDSEARRWVAAVEKKLAELGWKDGIDLRIEYRWRGNSPDRPRANAADIVNLNPTAILVTTPPHQIRSEFNGWTVYDTLTRSPALMSAQVDRVCSKRWIR